MKPNWKISLAAVLCTCAMLIPPKAQAVEIPPEVQAEFDRLMSIGAGDILDQYLSTLSEEVRDALMAADDLSILTEGFAGHFKALVSGKHGMLLFESWEVA